MPKTTPKKTAAKKPAVKKTAKKAVAKKTPAPKKSKVKFVSFTMGATIPTQAYGNITPSITVEAPSYEEARDFAASKIEELYKQYAETTPHFLGRVTKTEKVVKPSAPTPAPTPAPGETGALKVPTPQPSIHPEMPAEKPMPVQKAEKAISLATSHDALALIENQVNASVKISPEAKPDLLRQITDRRNELPF